MEEFYGRILHSRPSLSPEQERAALAEIERLAKHGTPHQLKRAKDRFIEANMRLVVRIARPYLRSPLREEIIQEGNMGLMRALETFNSSKGFRFNTYASWWIRAYIRRYMHENRRIVRVPEGMEKMISQVRRLDSVSTAKNEPEIDSSRVARELSVSLELAGVLITLARVTSEHVSLDAALFDDEINGKALSTILQGGDMNDDVDLRELARWNALTIERGLHALSARERKIIIERFALSEELTNEKTLREIGDELNLSRERVRQIQDEAFQKMRHSLARVHAQAG